MTERIVSSSARSVARDFEIMDAVEKEIGGRSNSNRL